MTAVDTVDHLLLGVADLDTGIDWFEKNTGVRAVFGGVHPGRGTRNALAALGGRRYLEIIAPDPAQTTYQFHLDVRTLEMPRLITWAATVPDLDAVVRRAASAGYQVFGPSDGARDRPDGRTLRWRTAGLMTRFGEGAIEPLPFLISWAAGSVHPSVDSPSGCTLDSLLVAHPEPRRIQEPLTRLGLDVPVRQEHPVRLIASLQTPNGHVELS